eukprot:6176282-Pleurochrysis_carterae.AAC.2
MPSTYGRTHAMTAAPVTTVAIDAGLQPTTIYRRRRNDTESHVAIDTAEAAPSGGATCTTATIAAADAAKVAHP